MKPAIFLDRDGTLIEPVHYLSHPDQVRLRAGVESALTEWQRLGFLRIVVTNQAAVSKGLLSLAELELVHVRLLTLLGARGAGIDGIYFCTEPQRGSDRTRIEHPDRKPGPGLLLRAAAERHVDLARSWMIGDTLTDTLAGRNAGCETNVLVRGGSGGAEDERHPSVDFIVDDLPEAVRLLHTQRATRHLIYSAR